MPTPSNSVRFAEWADVYDVISWHDMTDEEIASTWRSADDTKMTQDDLFKNVREMRAIVKSGKRLKESEDLCVRGLEHMKSATHVQQRKTNKAAVRGGLLLEQKRQREEHIFDEAKMAEVSMHNSKRVRDKARYQAALDAAYSRSINIASSASQPWPSDNEELHPLPTGATSASILVELGMAPETSAEGPTQFSCKENIVRENAQRRHLAFAAPPDRPLGPRPALAA